MADTLAAGMRRARASSALVALVLVPLAPAGCAFEGQIAVQLLGRAPAVVKQSAKVELTPNRAQGTTTRRGQVVRIDCSVTGVFDVREATGSAVLVQLYVVHLRTRPLPRGAPYQLDCAGSLIAQLPADVSDVSASATDSAGQQVALPVQSPVTAIPLAFGRRLRPQLGTRFAVASLPDLSPGGYTLGLAFTLPRARTFREKALYAASVSCGRSKYLQPIRPVVTGMARVPAFTILPSGAASTVTLPHLFGGIRSYGEATRTLSCAR
jgi:hypothetical protein